MEFLLQLCYDADIIERTFKGNLENENRSMLSLIFAKVNIKGIPAI